MTSDLWRECWFGWATQRYT